MADGTQAQAHGDFAAHGGGEAIGSSGGTGEQREPERLATEDDCEGERPGATIDWPRLSEGMRMSILLCLEVT